MIFQTIGNFAHVFIAINIPYIFGQDTGNRPMGPTRVLFKATFVLILRLTCSP